MKNIAMAFAVGLMAAGCGKAPETQEQFHVEMLFTHDDVSMYRVEINGKYVYYTKQKGNGVTAWSESCGKSCRKIVEVYSNVN